MKHTCFFQSELSKEMFRNYEGLAQKTKVNPLEFVENLQKIKDRFVVNPSNYLILNIYMYYIVL